MEIDRLGLSESQQKAFGFGPRPFAPPRRHACPPRRRATHKVLPMAAEGALASSTGGVFSGVATAAAVAASMRAATMLCMAVTQ